MHWVLVGASLAVAQWCVLRRHLSRPHHWAVATAIGAALGIIVSRFGVVLVSVTLAAIGILNFIVPAFDLTGFSFGAWIGVSIGTMQWLVLRSQFRRAHWLLLANGVGWGVSWVVGYSIGVAMGSDTVNEVLEGIITGTTTGIVLVHLLRNRAAESPR